MESEENLNHLRTRYQDVRVSPYHEELLKNLKNYFIASDLDISMDKEGDIWISEIHSEEQLNKLYKTFFTVLEELPDIDQAPERIAVYFQYEEGKTYKHLINPLQEDIQNIGKFPL